MSARRPLLRFEDKLAGEKRFLERLADPDDPRFLRNAVLGAIVIHAGLLLLPAPPAPVGEGGEFAPVNGTAVWRALPAPGGEATAVPVSRRAPGGFRLETIPAGFALVPLPHDPVPEPAPDLAPNVLARDPELLLGRPEPPPSASGPVSAADVPEDTEAVAELRVRAEYPEPALSMRAEGTVVLAVEIRADGSVGSIRVTQCSVRNVGFERAAMRAVRQWRYRPATRGGVAVPSRTEVFLEFRR